jgi:hypothetical protein
MNDVYVVFAMNRDAEGKLVFDCEAVCASRERAKECVEDRNHALFNNYHRQGIQLKEVYWTHFGNRNDVLENNDYGFGDYLIEKMSLLH